MKDALLHKARLQKTTLGNIRARHSALLLSLPLSKGNSRYEPVIRRHAHSLLARTGELSKMMQIQERGQNEKWYLRPFCLHSFYLHLDHLQILMNVPWAILVEMGPARMWSEVLSVPVRRDLSPVQWWHVKASTSSTEDLVAYADHGNRCLTIVLNQIAFIIN